MYSMVPVVNNKIYLKFPKGINLKWFYTQRSNCEMKDMFISLIVVIISQYTCIKTLCCRP